MTFQPLPPSLLEQGFDWLVNGGRRVANAAQNARNWAGQQLQAAQARQAQRQAAAPPAAPVVAPAAQQAPPAAPVPAAQPAAQPAQPAPTPAPSAPPAQPAAQPNRLQHAATAVGRALTGQGLFGMPVWTTLLLAALAVFGLQSFLSGTTFQLPTGLEAAIEATADTRGLWTIGGVTLPVKIVAVPKIPLTGASQRDIVAVVLVVSFVAVMVLDNLTARPNQQPALRANVGFLAFWLGVFVPGWWAIVFALTGALLARRPRGGGQMRPWPIIIAMAFALYVWFDVVAPMIPQVLGLVGQYAPWIPPFVQFLFSADNGRFLGLVAYAAVLVESIRVKNVDETTIIVLGASVLAWRVAFGVFPYAENITSWLDPVLFWTIYGLITLGLLVEHAQAGSGQVAMFTVLLFGVGYLMSLGVRALIDTTGNDVARVATQPLAFGYLLLGLLALAIGSTIRRGGPTLQPFLQVATSWTGAFVYVGPFAIPVDAFITAGLIGFGLLVGTDWPIL